MPTRFDLATKFGILAHVLRNEEHVFTVENGYNVNLLSHRNLMSHHLFNIVASSSSSNTAKPLRDRASETKGSTTDDVRYVCGQLTLDLKNNISNNVP